ncbi:MAG: N-acetylglucosamine-6-phosphate deacetylase [Chloroflexota bacterium]
MSEPTRISGRLVVGDRVVLGHVVVEGGIISEVRTDPSVEGHVTVAPGYIDIHVHGWGGHNAMGGAEALSGMARALAARGVTSFLPTAVTGSLKKLAAFCDTTRDWIPGAPGDGAEPLGFNLEGPFLADAKKGAHPAELLRDPADIDEASLAPLLDGLRVITIAPELPGALELISRLAARGVRVSLGHSAASPGQSRAGYAAGATSTTHLFNAMSGLEHRDPGLAVEALLDDDVWVELIADGQHVDAAMWPLVWRLKPAEKPLLVSDAIPLAGSGETRGMVGELEVELNGERVTLLGSETLAGSVTALDLEVRNVVRAGGSLHGAVAAASTNPAALLGLADRGRLEAGLRADLVELDADLRVRRVMRAGGWIA